VRLRLPSWRGGEQGNKFSALVTAIVTAILSSNANDRSRRKLSTSAMKHPYVVTM
jgi:hypothetical protein